MKLLSRDKESELIAIFNELCIKHKIDVYANPEHYEIKSPAAIDVEHDESGNLVGIGVYDGKSSLYFTLITSNLYTSLLSIQIIAHNGKGDMDCLRTWGIDVQDEQLIWDTELIGHIIDSSHKGYGLKSMAKRDLAIEYLSYDDIVGKKTAKERRTLDKWPVKLVSMYNAFDTYCTWKLYKQQNEIIQKLPYVNGYGLFRDLEDPVSKIFQSMENRGIRIDVPYLKQLKIDLEAQQLPIKESILNELGPINLNSPKQLLEALHAKGINPEFKGKPSTDKRALASLQTFDVIKTLLQFSELETLLSSFVSPYLERNTEIVHPFFNQCGTRTGRPSCSNPNLLQIPRRTENGKLVRRMFIPRDGMLMGDCDFGQIEPRVMAHLSKDPVLCQMFNEGIDFHTFTAERLGISRDRAKVLNLSVGYRATFKSVQAQLGGTREEAQSQIDKWWSLFPSLRRWQETLIYASKKSGFCTTFLGRRIKVDRLESYNSWEREAAERQLINNITQGSAAEIMKMAMIKMYRDIPNLGLLVQVYDELLFEEPINQIEGIMDCVKEYMVNAVELEVPLTVEGKIGSNWAVCK